MKKIIVFFSISILGLSSVTAQKKKDLLAEIDKLRQEINTVKSELHESRKKEKVGLSKVQSLENQVNDLRETNASLLANMGNFTELSKKKAQNLEKSLETIKEKDLQLNTVNKAISSSDSTRLAVLTLFKNNLKGAAANEASIGVKKGTIYITLANSFLFGNDDNTTVTDKAKVTLESIANTINSTPDLSIYVEGNSNAIEFKNKTIKDNWDLSSLQAAEVIRTLQNKYKVDPKRIDLIAKSEYGSESIETSTRIAINPKFDHFYNTIKESMK